MWSDLLTILTYHTILNDHNYNVRATQRFSPPSPVLPPSVFPKPSLRNPRNSEEKPLAP